jgi:D-xylose transport system ATP-binding protein
MISHNMSDIQAVCDRICVLRLGRCVATFNPTEATTDRLVAAMVGNDASDELASPAARERLKQAEGETRIAGTLSNDLR